MPTLWDLSIRETGSPVPLIDACESRLRARLEEALLAAPEDGEPDLATPDITALRRLTGRLSRVLGDLERAYDLVAKIPPELETRADRIERAQLLDALGRDEEAHKAFGRVLEEEIDPELRQEILLRRALLLDPKEERLAAARGERVGSVIGSLITSLAIPLTPAGTTAAATLTPATPTTPAAPAGTGSAIAIPAGLVGALPTGAAPSRRREEEPERKPTALARFALDPERDAALANQAAMILGLRGEQSDAIEAFRVMDGDGSHRYRQEVRLAEWALEAEEWEAAQAFSWAAVRSAKMKRDRRYALTILVEAYRRDRALPALIEQIAAESELSEETRQVWIDLLRETGQVEAALTLFREGSDGEFTIDMRRELLEMCRETGQEALLVSAYADLIAQEPRFIEWREGLSRYHLERGDRERALTVWSDYLSVTDDLRYRMAAASTLMAIGLDDRAVEFARACQGQGPEARNGALLFLFELSLARSRMDEARER
ncbi:MAG: tetratricopeptide repeat protein, partial [Planctomycetota bacterium]